MKYDIIGQCSMITSIRSNAAFQVGRPRRGSGLAATLPRLCCPDPALAEPLGPDLLRPGDRHHPGGGLGRSATFRCSPRRACCRCPGPKFGLSPHHERLVLIQIYYAVRQERDFSSDMSRLHVNTWQVIYEIASKRSFNNFNYGGDIRAATRWCVVLDCVLCQFMMIFKLSPVRMHPSLSQQKFFDFLGTHISMPIITYYHCNVGLALRPICNVGLEDRPICFRSPTSLFHISF